MALIVVYFDVAMANVAAVYCFVVAALAACDGCFVVGAMLPDCCGQDDVGLLVIVVLLE